MNVSADSEVSADRQEVIEMEKNLYIVRCGEVALKGMNKPYFERVLLERVKNALSCYEGAEAKWIEGLMFVRVPEKYSEDEVIASCVRVFGVASVSPAVVSALTYISGVNQLMFFVVTLTPLPWGRSSR